MRDRLGQLLVLAVLVVAGTWVSVSAQEIFDPSGGTANPTFSSQVKSGDGTALVPGYGFTLDTDTGFYRIGANNLGAAAGGVLRWDFNTTRFNLSAGYALTWTGFGGITSPADGVLTLRNNLSTGFDRLQFGGTTSAFPALHSNGTALEVVLADNSGPASLTVGGIQLLNDTLTFTGLGDFSATTDGVFLLLDSTSTTFTQLLFGGTSASFPSWKRSGTTLIARLANDSADSPLQASLFGAGNGLVSAPSLSFSGDPDTGFYNVGANNVGASAGNALVFDFNATRLNLAAAYQMNWTGRGGLSAPGDGITTLLDNAGTSYGRLQFGGTTSAFPALKRSTTTLQSRLADDSGDANLQAGRIFVGRQQVTVADNGAGTAAAFTLTPSADFIELTCNDANGCDCTVSEVGAVQGNTIKAVNITANVVNFADTAGVTELAGAFAMGQFDSLVLLYVADRYVELSRSNN